MTANGDHHRLADHPTVDPPLVVHRIDQDAPVIRGERSRPEGLHQRIKLAANTRHFRFRDTVRPERFHQLIYRRVETQCTCASSTGEERMLRAPAGLQQ